jgi:bile acid:Na+ symporter, BASS family
MDTLDQINVALNQQDLFWMNVCLAFLMFGVALDIAVLDFTTLIKQPKAVLTGLASQLLLLPALTLMLIIAWRPHPGMALGMLLVASCPGGNVSNFLVHLMGGNRALSVTLTSISTIISFVYTPASLWFWGTLYPPTADILRQFSISIPALLSILAQLIVLPLIAGMALNYYAGHKLTLFKKWIRITSITLFAGLIAVALFANTQQIGQYLHLVFILVLAHNGIAIFSGWGLSRILRLPVMDQRTIGIETGIQNSGLGLIIIMNFYDGMGAMLLVAAWWGIWHLISGTAMAWWWGRKGKHKSEFTDR